MLYHVSKRALPSQPYAPVACDHRLICPQLEGTLRQELMPRVQHHLRSSAHLPRTLQPQLCPISLTKPHTTKHVLSWRHLRLMASQQSLTTATFDIPKTVVCFPGSESSLGVNSLWLSQASCCLGLCPSRSSVLPPSVISSTSQLTLGQSHTSDEPSYHLSSGGLKPTSPASPFLLLGSLSPLDGFILQVPQNKPC